MRHPDRGGLFLSRPTKLFLVTLVILTGTFFRLHLITTLPPGDSYDPAYYGLDALRILGGDYPVYFATNFGREALFSYAVAAAYAIVGPGTLGIHLASALISLLTIPAVFLAANELFKRHKAGLLPQFGGLLAALILALSFWHLTWSRYSVRAILIPLFVSLLCFFLLKALRTQRRRHFALTGLVMGLSLYTYQLAQVFPVLVGLGFVYDLVARRSLAKKDGVNFLLIYGTGLLIALPLIFYAANNPGVFNQRVGNVFVLRDSAPLPETIMTLSQYGWQVVKMYTVEGDTNLQINIPQRPSFNPFLAASLLVGLGISLYHWRRPHYLFLLSWFLLLSVPAILADDAALSKRTLGALPAATILITLGLLLPLDWLRRWQIGSARSKKWPATVYTLLLCGGLLFTAVNTFRDYFITWASDPDLYTAYDVGIAEIGKFIGTLPESETIYLTPSWGDHASLQLHANNRSGIRTYDGRYCVVYPQITTSPTNFVIITSGEENSLPLLQSYFPQADIIHEELTSDGLRYLAYQIPPGVSAEFESQEDFFTNWNDEVALIAYELSGDEFKKGDTITVDLYFQPLANMSAGYTVYVHLLGDVNPDNESPIWAQVDREPCFQSYPTFWWDEGEIIRDTFHLATAENLPPGEYLLAVGFYLWPELFQLPLVEATHDTFYQAVILQSIQILP